MVYTRVNQINYLYLFYYTFQVNSYSFSLKTVDKLVYATLLCSSFILLVTQHVYMYHNR